MSDNLELQGHRALVTGGTKEIGQRSDAVTWRYSDRTSGSTRRSG
jgi:hypothetical protein